MYLGRQRQIITQNQVPVEQLTPKRKTIATMEKYFKGKVTRHHPVTHQLFLHNIIKQTLRDKYQAAKRRIEEKDMITNKTIKKYHLLCQCLFSYLGLSNRTVKPISDRKNLVLKQKIISNFFEHDEKLAKVKQ